MLRIFRLHSVKVHTNIAVSNDKSEQLPQLYVPQKAKSMVQILEIWSALVELALAGSGFVQRIRGIRSSIWDT